MKTYVFDTNVIIDFVLERIMYIPDKRKDLTEIFRKAHINQRILPLNVLTEFSSVMQKSIPFQYNFKEERFNLGIKEITQNFIESANKIALIYYPSQKHYLSAVNIYSRKNKTKNSVKRLDFSDCLLHVISQENAYELITNDKELLKISNNY